MLLTLVIVYLLVTIAIAALLDRSHAAKGAGPAGFASGVIDGALMPGTLPPLLLGRDVTIYAPNNSGRTYKLGYTVGVNACGALFFGLVYWRVIRFRRRAVISASDALKPEAAVSSVAE